MRVGLMLGMLLVVGGVQAGENTLVGLRDVPDVVRQAADQDAPDVKWVFGVKDGNGWYKLVGKDSTKHLVEFFTSPEGKDSYVHIEVSVDEVPPVVSAALKAKMPDFEPKKVQACGLDAKTITSYRFQGEEFQGGNAGVYVSVSGKKVTPLK
jgi:hypothetical protein